MSQDALRLVFDLGLYQIRGPRDYQNDSYAGGPTWIAIADGMGAAPDARIAADVAVQQVQLVGRGPHDGAAIRRGLDTLVDRVSEALRADRVLSGTTLTGAVLDDSGQLHVVHVGDSRLMRLRGAALERLTTDDNRSAMGDTDVNATSALTRYLAAVPAGAPRLSVLDASAGDTLILTTDGLHNRISEHQIAASVGRWSTPQRLSEDLLALAERTTLTDNATCCVIRIEEAPAS